MSGNLALHADALLNAIALAGLLYALIAVPRGAKASALDQRLDALYVGLLLFLGLRQAFWFFAEPWLVPAIMATAAWLPLLVLLLVEELLRRHAPRPLKWFTLAGGAVFTVTALIAGAVWPPLALMLFAGDVVVVLLAVIAFIVRDRRRDLSPAETRMADSVVLALLVCVPLSITEFRALFPALPITFGYLGILLFTVMTTTLATGNGFKARFALDLLAFAMAGLVVAWATAWLLPALALTDLIRLGALVISVNAVTLMVSRLNAARRAGHRRTSIAATLAALPDDAGEDMIIGAHPITASGAVIAGDGLAPYGDETVRALAGFRVLDRSTASDPEVSSAISNLLDDYGASHLVRLSARPLRLLAVAAGTIGGANPIETELALLSRIVEGAQAC